MVGLYRLIGWRNFAIILTADTLSNSGLWFGILANLQFLQMTVPSDFVRSLILVAGPVLGILISPKAGVVIDRHAKKRVLMVSSLLQLASAVMMMTAMYLQSVPLMVAGLLIANVGNSLYIPTLQSVIPMVVRKEHLVRANAAYSNLVTMTRIGATAVAGLLLTVLPLYGMYIAVFLFYCVMTAFRYLLRFEEQPANSFNQAKQKISFFEVFPLLRATPPLLFVIAAGTLVFLFLGGFNLLILKFSETQNDPALKGWLYTIEGIFVLIGGFAVRKWFSGGDLLRRSVFLLAGVAASIFLMHFADQQWEVMAGFGLFGLMLGAWSPMQAVIPQLLVPEDIRGRYFALQAMWNRTMFQLALLLTGAMLDLIGLAHYLLVLSIVIFAGFLVMLVSITQQKLRVESPRQNVAV
ncbi:MFS transporter [Effusibacillus pohliae]|uniref:MFS transporter n=1 Tax=Effusibacillus pohliae TaxID=232270 RepID=UPI00036449A7|nr:MFS transporter [Effusibacillus pohliae]